LLRFDPFKPRRDFLLAVQPIEFIKLFVAEHAGGGNAGDARDRRHGSIGTYWFSRAKALTGFKRRMLRKARFEIGEPRFGLASRAKHRLQGLGLLIYFEFDKIRRTFERDALGFQINLPCDTGAREILAVLRNRETDFFRQPCDFGIELTSSVLYKIECRYHFRDG
jgi:hypothetical protein